MSRRARAHGHLQSLLGLAATGVSPGEYRCAGQGHGRMGGLEGLASWSCLNVFTFQRGQDFGNLMKDNENCSRFSFFFRKKTAARVYQARRKTPLLAGCEPRSPQAADHPGHLMLPESRYLRALLLHLF